jgi:predicted acetyltransferase
MGLILLPLNRYPNKDDTRRDMTVHYLADNDVTPILDMQLRFTLSRCFSDQKAIFSKQRFFKEAPQHRYYIEDDADNIIAHVAVHDKTVLIDGKQYSVAGIAEVCVLPEHRKKGFVGQIFKCLHRDLKQRNVDFSILFGDYVIYGSSGYKEIHNLVMQLDGQWKNVPAMAKGIATPWPDTDAFIEGPTF